MMSSMVDSKAGRAPRPSSGLDMAGLGARLRAERLRRRLSLHDLEARTGVSRSMLSEVERGSKVPTVLVLDRIATGLDTNIARLLGEERATRVVVLRRGEHDTAHDSSGWERRILSPVLPGVEFELMRTTIPGGVDAGEFAAHAPGSRETSRWSAVSCASRSTASSTGCALATASTTLGTAGTPSPIPAKGRASTTSRWSSG